MWLIFRVRRSAPESRLPMVVWSSLVAHDSVMRRFYVPLIPLGSNGDENRRAPICVYWTLCWDSKINVDRQYYNFQHSERVDFAFVRVDHDGMLPNVSKMDASWEKGKRVCSRVNSEERACPLSLEFCRSAGVRTNAPSGGHH